MGDQNGPVIVFLEIIDSFGFHQADGLLFPARHVTVAEGSQMKHAIGCNSLTGDKNTKNYKQEKFHVNNQPQEIIAVMSSCAGIN
jgi:hypothetical protein